MSCGAVGLGASSWARSGGKIGVVGDGRLCGSEMSTNLKLLQS
jgi:hypothetical protein